MKDANGTNIIEKNASRWNILPAGNHRLNVTKLSQFNDRTLKWLYKYFSLKWKKERKWEHEKYKQIFKGKNILEVGGGLGYDGIVYSEEASSYTFAELNQDQINFIKRICKLHHRDNIHFELLKDAYNHRFAQMFQGFYAHGVLHHVPFETAKLQFQNIDKYMEIGAYAVFLMYPKERWINAGSPPFEQFGEFTDGGCPWAEYYDIEKIQQLTGPNYKLIDVTKWGQDNAEFINFELEKIK